MGDPLAEQAEYLLQVGTGQFPGDDIHRTGDPRRFHVFCVSNYEHATRDHEDQRDPETTILTSHLMNPQFCLEGWYSKHLGKLRGYTAEEIQWVRRWQAGSVMGNPLGQLVTEFLQANCPDEGDLV
ncbi:hypothetical protein BDR07DRAFT_1247012, partial [Suillus spraguei]